MGHDLPTGDRPGSDRTPSVDRGRGPSEVVSLATWGGRQDRLPASRIVTGPAGGDAGDGAGERDYLTEAIQIAERKAPPWLLAEPAHLEALWAKVVPILQDYSAVTATLDKLSRLL